MKTKLLIIGLAIGLHSNAQITVNSTEFIKAGETQILAFGPVVTTNASPGANKTWNYAALDSSYGKDTTSFVLPSATLYSSSFPTSTMAIEFPRDTSAEYYNKTTSSLDIVGFEDPTGPIHLSDPMSLIKFPITYGARTTDTYAAIIVLSGAIIGPGIDSVRLTLQGYRIHKVDSWGSLTLPTGTFDALRIKDTTFESQKLETKSSGVWTFISLDKDTSYSNYFVSNNIKSKYFLLTQYLDNNGIVIDNEWDIATPSLAGINENYISIDLLVYPNPVVNVLKIESKSEFNKYIITDLLGKEIKQENKNNIKEISVESLTRGQYFITLYSNEGNITKRFSKQ